MALSDQVMDALRPLAIPPGDYMVPRPSSRQEMRSPAFADKMKKGPVMVLTVMPNGPMSMGSPSGRLSKRTTLHRTAAGAIAIVQRQGRW